MPFRRMPMYPSAVWRLTVLLAACIAVLVILPVSASAPRSELKLLADPMAKCLDGSQAGYYFRPSQPRSTGSGSETSDVDSTKWMLYMQGGGWCWTPETCYLRSQMAWGSSTTWPPVVTDSELLVHTGPQSLNCTLNPTFCDFNYVFIRYCDGNSFSGYRTEPYMYQRNSSSSSVGVVEEVPLFFRGKYILNAILADILASNPRNRTLAQATEFVVQGCSAGGLATYLHSDDIRRWLLPRAPLLVKFGAIPWSGFFLDHPNIRSQPIYEEHIRYIFALSNATHGVSSKCIEAMQAEAPTELWRCNMAPYVFSYSTVPTFVVNSKVDAWQTTCILDVMPIVDATTTFMGGNCSAVPGYSCYTWNDVTACDAAQVAPLLSYQGSFLSYLYSIPSFQYRGNGVFLHACYTHCEVHHFYDTIQVQNVTMAEAVRRWWDDVNGTHAVKATSRLPAGDDTTAGNAAEGAALGHWYNDCAWDSQPPYYCNPTCPHGSPKGHSED